jgi:hypothetical protein
VRAALKEDDNKAKRDFAEWRIKDLKKNIEPRVN